MPLVEKLTENVFNDFYITHPKGIELFTLDLQETLNHRCDSLICDHIENNAQLETEIKDLKDENSILHTRIEELQQTP